MCVRQSATKGVDLYSNFVVVTPTYNAVAKYFSRVFSLFDLFWPNHPEVLILWEDEKLDTKDAAFQKADPWLVSLHRGLLSLKSSKPHVTHVFMLLDDHYPLRACDERRLAAEFRLIATNQLACVSFVTYTWPWNSTEHVEYSDGMIRTWRQIDIVRFDDCELARVPLNFFRYFQLQPSLWEIDYLIDVCREALEKKCLDPWSFESFVYSSPRQHYVSRYPWPSVHHGFLEKGKINLDAISFIQMPQGRKFRSFLLKEALGFDSILRFRINRFLSWGKATLARRLRWWSRKAIRSSKKKDYSF